MSTRTDIVKEIYSRYDEDGRLLRTRQGQLEYLTTMAYIHHYASEGSRVLEIGAGTGRYSIALAKEGMDVTAVELLESNLAVLKENSKGMGNIRSFRGDATDLGMLVDDCFDVTLVFGPMYHLYDPEEISKATDEAVRVTKPGGIIMFAFLSIYALMHTNYLFGNWAAGFKENYTDDLKVKHFKEQLFTGYDVEEFENLFTHKPVEWITTAAMDGPLELVEPRINFDIPDEDFRSFAEWHLAYSDKRETLGASSHLLYICRRESAECEECDIQPDII